MLLLLLQYLGVKGMGRGALLAVKWAVRLVVFGLLAIAVLLLIIGLATGNAIAWKTLLIGAVIIGGVFAFAAWQKSRRGISEEISGDRTIDGKVVPDMLAVAALDVPAYSPDADDVLRGIPEFGKTLLGLDLSAFEYVPPVPHKAPEPVATPALPEPLETDDTRVFPAWAIAAGVAVVLAVSVPAVLAFTPITENGNVPPYLTGRAKTDWEMGHTSSGLRHSYLGWRWQQEPSESIAMTPPETAPQPQPQPQQQPPVQETQDSPPPQTFTSDPTPEANNSVDENLSWASYNDGQGTDQRSAASACKTGFWEQRRGWRLPTRKELAFLARTKDVLATGYATSKFWTSEETSTPNVYYYVHVTGNGSFTLEHEYDMESSIGAVCVHS